MQTKQQAYKKIKRRSCHSGECTLWEGAVSWSKYGIIQADGHTAMVHKVVYEILNGPVPSKNVLTHSCGNRLCVNPNHIILTTKSEIFRQKTMEGAFGKVKLTPENVKDIWFGLKQGASGRSLARRYMVSPMTVSHIRKGKTWSYVTEKL